MANHSSLTLTCLVAPNPHPWYNMSMATHQMNLQNQYFNFTKNGTKRIELRLFDEKRQKIQLGDIIKFSNSTNESIQTQVIGLLRYKSFDDLLKDFDTAILADESISKDELKSTLEEFYTPEKQQEYGVIGIRIDLL